MRKLELSGRVQRPAEAKSLSDVPAALEAWDTEMREFIEAGGRVLSFDDRKMALLHIIPDQMKADIMLRLHMFPEPPAGSSQDVQDESFAKLRTALQKQLELTIQFQAMGSMRSGRPLNTMGNGSDEPSAEGSNTAASWDDEELPEDDPSYPLYQMAMQAYAVYQNSRGKGKGKGKVERAKARAKETGGA